MAERPLLSVITASLNLVSGGRSELFREMADSTAHLAALCPVEHLIQDGGSQDGSLALYREYGSALNVFSAPDHGIYDAMNRAAENAAGQYLAFMNSDDFFHDPEALAAFLEELQRTRTDYGFAPVRRIRTNGKSEIRNPKMYSIFSRMPYCHQTLIVSRSCFMELGGYDTRFRIVADHDFALRLYLAGRTCRCCKKSYATFRSGGLSHDKARNHLERAEIFRKLYSPWYPAPEEEFRRIAANEIFPGKLFRKLLQQAPAQDRMRMRWWYWTNWGMKNLFQR